MDSEFDRRWRAAQAPFDGVTVVMDKLVALPVLRRALIAVVGVLHAHRPGEPLFRLQDWHDHDGFVTKAHPSSWLELRSLLDSDDALAGASAGETHVRTAFFPQGRDFLLRVYVPDVYDNPYHAHDDPRLVHYGLFDVTCQWPLALALREAAQGAWIAALVRPAKAFFDTNYSG